MDELMLDTLAAELEVVAVEDWELAAEAAEGEAEAIADLLG